MLFEGGRGLGVEAEDKGRGVDSGKNVRVVRVGSEVLEVLQFRMLGWADTAHAAHTHTLAQTSRFDAVSIPTPGYSLAVLS